MRMSHAQMYQRLLASDSSWNGRFFTGVLTTGIYCLPSCKARKPKAENVRFFPTCEAARAAGLRACRKCHPDDFARGADPVLETIEVLVGEVRSEPARFADARAMVRRSGFGSTRLFELFRLHYHLTPAEVLLRARLDDAKRRLASGRGSLAEIAGAAGFESLSVFHEQFRARNGLTPAAYRDLGSGDGFAVSLPRSYPLAYLQRALSRDPQSATERWEGTRYRTAVELEGSPTLMSLELGGAEIRVKRERSLAAKSGAPWGFAAHAVVVGLLGLDEDAAAFARLATRLGFGRLVAGRRELRISRTPSVFDGLLWSIVGQQINFAFACVLKRRLIEKVGVPLGEGFYAPPLPAAIARLDPADLRPLQYSASKAAYLIGAARLVAEGKLDLEGLGALSATRAERTLLAVHGLGPWSVNYLMMRSLGFPDCVPLGDTGVTSGLQSLFQLEDRPDIDATRRLMAVFSPYRSLATTHLWQFNRPAP
jgi:AraC family transcriptional regulator, regulatory protein of adaptative response / DNA-3-methyladenine glycosylase II